TIGIDTYRSDRGQFRLPGSAELLPIGVEFAVTLRDTTDAALWVTPPYNPYVGPRAGMQPTDLDVFYHNGATVDARRDDGAYDSLFGATNRSRVTRDGRTVPARGVNRGRLGYRVDWYWDRAACLVELRLPWGLLNVTDPSSRRVLAAVRDPVFASAV